MMLKSFSYLTQETLCLYVTVQKLLMFGLVLDMVTLLITILLIFVYFFLCIILTTPLLVWCVCAIHSPWVGPLGPHTQRLFLFSSCRLRSNDLLIRASRRSCTSGTRNNRHSPHTQHQHKSFFTALLCLVEAESEIVHSWPFALMSKPLMPSPTPQKYPIIIYTTSCHFKSVSLSSV